MLKWKRGRHEILAGGVATVATRLGPSARGPSATVGLENLATSFGNYSTVWLYQP